ncbi:unnamed protein product [Rotaria sordida]|uniref:Uncharacterized protein n=1 Tax=Rotaria sordida TaxID=392033 RepID=A0A814PDQ2_9BILA|nr:unnamed protein product [Rotaria sordida]
MNNSNIDTTFSQETQNLTPDRYGVHVKFDYSFDQDQLLPTIQTIRLKSEPCFNVIATEDEVTKHFYENKSEIISNKHDRMEFIKRRTSNEFDSFENKYSHRLIKERETTDKVINIKHIVPDQSTSSSSIKSILKKPEKKEERSISKKDELSISPSSSRSSSKKKPTLSTRLDFNQVQHLVELTAKQYSSLHSIQPRSLFDKTINIFDPNYSYQITSNNCRPFRFQYYMKPYREEANTPTNISKQRSRSLSPNRLAQQSDKRARSRTFSNQYSRPSRREFNRRQDVSWSPVREYTDQGRDDTIKTATKKKEKSSRKTNTSSLSTCPSLSLIKPCQRKSPSKIPVPIRHRISRSSQSPSPPLSIDSYHTPSLSESSLTSITPLSQQSYSKAEEEIILKSHLPDIVYQHDKERDETMQRYDRLLEKIRATDEQLQSLSRSWISNTPQRTPVSKNSLFYEQILENYKREFFHG